MILPQDPLIYENIYDLYALVFPKPGVKISSKINLRGCEMSAGYNSIKSILILYKTLQKSLLF